MTTSEAPEATAMPLAAEAVPPAPPADAWLLPEGARLLHVGPPGTGGAAIRAALSGARDALADQGVEAVDAGPDWRALVGAVATSRAARVITSSDELASSDASSIHSIVAELDQDRVHVVATLRSIPEVLRRQWQQLVLDGETAPFQEWLRPTLAAGAAGDVRGFWGAHRHDLVVARWATAIGAGRITAIVTGEGRRVAGTLEALLGLHRRTLAAMAAPEDRMLTMPELEVLRAVNVGLQDLQIAEGRREQTLAGVVPSLLRRTPRQGEPRLALPDWAVEDAAALSREIASAISASGVRVVGELGDLLVEPAGLGEPAADIDDATWADIGAQTALGILEAGGLVAAATQGLQRTEPLEVAGVGSPRLAAMLVRRGVVALANRRGATAPEPPPVEDD